MTSRPTAWNAWRTLAVLWFAALLALPAPAQTLQLADGSMLLATVEDVNGDGLRVRRLDNGGVLELQWSHLTPGCALRVKQQNGLAGSDDEELMVDVSEVTFLLHGSPTAMIGKVDNTQPNVIVLQSKGQQVRIPRENLTGTGIKPVRVPAAQVYTLDEFYNQRLAELQPGDDADQHMRLAEDLIRIRDYKRAGEHLQRAAELGTSKDPKGLAALTARLEQYKKAAEERSLLDQIRTARARGTTAEFQKGLSLIADYERDYVKTGKARLKPEFEAESRRFQAARDRYLSLKVGDQWRGNIKTIAEAKVRDMTLQQARDYAEQAMRDDIVARVGEQLKLEPDEVKRLWGLRGETAFGKRTELFSYQLGSWVLGPERVLEGTKRGEADTKDQQDSGQAQEIEQLARRLREGMQRRADARKAQGGAKKEVTEEDWWRSADTNERASWLRAYYAERSGDLVVVSVSADPCVACYGVGTMTDMGPQGKPVQVKCYLCHGTKFTRSFRAY